MTSSRSRRAALWFAAVVVAVLAIAGAVLLAVTRSSDADDGGRAAAGLSELVTTELGIGPADASPSTATPARHTGPQGRVGQFVVGCTYSHSGAHDPIVHPGREGRSHRHDFYGSVATDSASTAETLLGTETTCDKGADSAAYWQPTLYDGDRAVAPVEAHAYYRAAPGIDPTTVQTMPTGLAMIAGDQAAVEPQPGEATGWTCGTSTVLSDEIPDCAPRAPLHLVLTFPDCWDGRHVDSVDHRSHVDHSAGGACPGSHPVPIPQLTMSITFPVSGGGHQLRLASGSTYSAHGDFLNAWDPDGLQREVAACISRGAVCDLASNRGEEPLFSGGA